MDARRDHSNAVKDLLRNCEQAVRTLSDIAVGCDRVLAGRAGDVGELDALQADLHRFNYWRTDVATASARVEALQRALDEARLTEASHREDRGRCGGTRAGATGEGR